MLWETRRGVHAWMGVLWHNNNDNNSSGIIINVIVSGWKDSALFMVVDYLLVRYRSRYCTGHLGLPEVQDAYG